ncbi:hypothetical protein I3842_16G065600 [Carya illinoinensis]|uniref:NB-ARC domain-containing protein n=1 Tax=Carya illinoinensis TaxID=32201 RepID=A0A922A7N4_CARIL|nr:hypothetical protein I3842_16G065600 [Carya illinoinensis]
MEIISVFVEKLGEYSVGPIREQFGYLIFYKRHIAILKEEFPRLREKEEAVKQSVLGAQWSQEVVPNLKLRYSLGKKAQKNTQVINDMLKEGEKYDQVYNIKIPLEVKSTSTEWFKDFESRRSTIENVLEALRDENINMIALCGMGGIGKTEMAKEIARRVKAQSLFNKVAIAVVSQKADLIKVQDEIAEQLGPELHEKSLVGRASQLYSRLMDSKSVLVILDDVWDPLDLGAIGVIDAVKQKTCKILLTSRNEETCNWMRIQKIFPIGLLSEEEAWNLFIEMAGDCINTSNLILIARQVAKECACLPLAIATVGRALSNKSDKNEWKAALQQLKMSIPKNIYGLHPKVYSSIEFSYNYIESDEAKSCFLLCCLYPEDYDVPIEHLVRYGVAKRFFEGLDIVEQTRINVHAVVQNLRRSNLLLDSGKVECVKMHDIVRDVAISIASRDEIGFMVKLDRGLEEWPQKDRYDSYTAISLLLGELKVQSIELKCPKLQLLRLSHLNQSETLPGNLFNGMKELKMLSLQDCCFSLTSLPPSIQILQNLHMLHLESCRLGDVSAIGTLRNLEILGFHYSEIEELPLEIGNLSRLKLLDMKGCDSLKRIAPGVLSGLSQLEELYVGGFKNWGCSSTMEGNGEVTNNNASLAELIPYSSQLVVLEISVPANILCLPKELHFGNSNFRSRINIGINNMINGRYLFENTLSVGVEDASDLWEHQTILSLLKNAVVLFLDIATNLKHIWFEKEQKGVLPCNLKDLTIFKCEDLEYLLEATSDSTLPNTFHLLESLSLFNLPRLIGICKSTDSVEVDIKIWGCNLMENIIQREYEAGEERKAGILSSEAHSIKWPSIKKIELLECPILKTFGSEVKSRRKLRKMDAELDPRAQEPSIGSSLARESSRLLKRCLESCVPRHRNYSAVQGNRSSSLGENKHNLTREITLAKQGQQNVSETENHTKMLSLIPHDLIESLENLQKLLAYRCDSLEVIFELEGLNAEESNIFNNLTKLSLISLPKLLYIWKKGPREVKGFNYLRLLEVWSCDSLKCLFTPSIAKLLVKLEKIEVYDCNEIEEILAKEAGDEENRDVITFPLVKTLWLTNLQKLECFYIEDNHAFEWPSLDKITIAGCPNLKMFVSTSTKTPQLKGVHTKSETFQPMIEGDLNATIQHIIKEKVCYNL